jgi:secondary thiamine-phosphate synthase enzyme
MLSQASTRLLVKTQGPGFTDLTEQVGRWLREIRARDGLLTLFLRHTSASLVIQENTDPAVRRDLLEALERIAPRSYPYHHRTEGPDDMPAHIRSMLSPTSVAVPVSDGKPVLGTWQALYLVEHRDAPHSREIVLQFMGGLGSK